MGIVAVIHICRVKTCFLIGSCDSFSGFCDTAILIFDVNGSFCLELCHFLLKICHSSQSDDTRYANLLISFCRLAKILAACPPSIWVWWNWNDIGRSDVSVHDDMIKLRHIASNVVDRLTGLLYFLETIVPVA